jgi:hypothetical protein
MKKKIYWSPPLLQSLEAQIQSNEQLIHKDQPDTHLSVFPQKSLQRLAQTIRDVRVWTVERREDNTIWCKETGQKLPSTPQGKPDFEKLALEIAQKKLIGYQL